MTPPPRRPKTKAHKSDDNSASSPPVVNRPPVPPPVQSADVPALFTEPLAPPVQLRTAPTPPAAPTIFTPAMQAPSATPAPGAPTPAAPRITDDVSGAEQQKERRAARNWSAPTICCFVALVLGGAFIAFYHMKSGEAEPVVQTEPIVEDEPAEEEYDPEAVDLSDGINGSNPEPVKNEPATNGTENDVAPKEETGGTTESPPAKKEPTDQTSPPPKKTKPTKSKPKPKQQPVSTDPQENPLAYVKLVRDAHIQCRKLRFDTASGAGFNAFQKLLRLCGEVMAFQQDTETEEGLRVITMGPVTDALADLSHIKWPGNQQVIRFNKAELQQRVNKGKPVFAFTQVVRSTRGIPLVDGQPALLLEAIGTGHLIAYPVPEHVIVKKGTRFLIFGVQQPVGVVLMLNQLDGPQEVLLVRGKYSLPVLDKQVATNTPKPKQPGLQEKSARPNRRNIPVRRNRK